MTVRLGKGGNSLDNLILAAPRPAIESVVVVLRSETEQEGDDNGDARAPTGAAVEDQFGSPAFDTLIDDAEAPPPLGDLFEVGSEEARFGVDEVVPVSLVDGRRDMAGRGIELIVVGEGAPEVG